MSNRGLDNAAERRRQLDFDSRADKLRQLAKEISSAKKERDRYYFTKRHVSPDRDFLIVCRHWNSSTPVIPRRYPELLPYPRMAGLSFGGGYFLVLNGVGIVVDPGYGFMQLLYNSYGYTICDVDYVFVTHDHPDHWADLANILVLKYMASTYDGGESRDPVFYLNRSVNEIHQFLFSPGHSYSTMGRGQVVSIAGSDGEDAVEVTGMRAFHSERLCPTSNSPDVLGLHFQVAQLSADKPGLRSIAIAGDTQFPSVDKLKKGLLEFTREDEDLFAQEYGAGRRGLAECPRGERKIDVLAMHIGSVEEGIGDIPSQGALQYIRDNVFYGGYHLGFSGCLRLLDVAFRFDESGKLALLTEFGEELRGHRVDLAMALESATKANRPDPTAVPNVRVLPADVGMALQLSWRRDQRPEEPLLRCSKCLHLNTRTGEHLGAHSLMDEDLFHPISEIRIFEDLDTGLVQYCCQW